MLGVGALWFLALLCSVAFGENVTVSEEVKNVAESSHQEEESRSGAFAESHAVSDGGSAKSEAQSIASSDLYGGVSQALAQAESQASSNSIGSSHQSSAQAKSEAQTSGPLSLTSSSAKALAQAAGGSYGLGSSPYLQTYKPSYGLTSGSASAKAESGSQSSGINPYKNKGLNQYPSYKPSYNSGSSSASAQAAAEVQLSSGGVDQNNLAFYYPKSTFQFYSPNYYSAQSQAAAEAISSAASLHNQEINPYSSSYPYNPSYSAAQAQADADAYSYNANPYNHNYLYGIPSDYKPKVLDLKPPSSLASSSAQAQAVAQAAGNSNAQAVAEAEALSGSTAKDFLYPSTYSTLAPTASNLLGLGYTRSQSEAEAHALSSADAYGSFYPGNQLLPNPSGPQGNAEGSPIGQYLPAANPASLYPQSNSAYAQAESDARVSGSGSAQSSAIAQADAISRVISPSEYIYPQLTPGYEVAVKCARENELHYVWTPNFQCMVCICINDYGLLRPICASCSGCMNPYPNPGPTEPVITPVPPTYRPPVTEHFPVVTVQPLPELPSCHPLPHAQPFTNPLNPCQTCICIDTVNVLGQPDVKIECQDNAQCVIPPDVAPIPDVPIPVPLPQCDKFPQNVVFPHPTDSCKYCKCAVRITEFGLPEEQITCHPIADCIPVIDMQTVTPFPDIVTQETPVPWPPVTQPPKIVPGPLPGPSPHESCRPFKPNQPFEHPWDDCQICVCTESYGIGLITVEINCYTKKSCCAEPSDLLPATPPSLPSFSPSGNVVYPGSSVHSSADASASVVTHGQSGNYRPPGYNQYPINVQPQGPYLPSLGSSQTQASADASAIVQGIQNSPPYYGSSPYIPKSPKGSLLPGGSSASAKAEAEAVANTGYKYPYQSTISGYQPYGNFGSKPSNEAQSPIFGQNGFNYPSFETISDSEAEAIASALASSENNQNYLQGIPASSLYPTLYQRPSFEITPMYQPGSFGSSHSQALAKAQSQGFGSAQSQAQAKALSSYQMKSGNPEDDASE